jgi:hypothetical protein
MKKIAIMAIMSVLSLTLFGQVQFGPVIDLGLGFYSKTSDSLTLKGGIFPAFGVAMQQNLSQMLSLRGTATYSFKSLQATKVNGGAVDKLNGQSVDFCLAGKFSNFTNDVHALPYGMAGFGVAFNIVDKLQKDYLVDCTYNQVAPYFNVGAGVGIKMSFLSELDLSVNYSRFLVPMIKPSLPFDRTDARLNQFSIKIITLF